jgi:electron transport complex protein RnfB
MNLTTLLIQSVAVLGGLGLAVGILLIVASRKFKVETNPLVDEILSVLPNANCGACGYAGCADFAQRVVNEGAPINGCPVGGFEIAKQIGGIMDQDVSGLRNNILLWSVMAE